MDIQEISIALGAPGASQQVAVSGTSAQTAEIASDSAVVTPTVDVFVRHGSNPVALANGTDQFLLAGAMYRLAFPPRSRLAFITSGASGVVYLTPGA